MPFPKQEQHCFTIAKISTLQANQPGVYGIFSHAGCIFIERTKDIRGRLLLHVRRQSEQSNCIFEHHPKYWLAMIVEKNQLLTWEKNIVQGIEPCCLSLQYRFEEYTLKWKSWRDNTKDTLFHTEQLLTSGIQ